MEILIVDRSEFVDFAFGCDDYTDMEEMCNWVLRSLKENGNIDVTVENTFNGRDSVPYYVINFEDTDLEEKLNEEFFGELPLEFEFEGVEYRLELG